MTTSKGQFDCPKQCDLSEEEINTYNSNEFMEILELLENHGICVDDVETVMQAKALLFKHLKLKDKSGHGSVKVDVVQQVVKEHHNRRKKMLQIAKNVQTFLNELPANRKKELKRYFPSIDTDVQKAVEELDEKKFSFIVAGETGSGKSCFINLLMGQMKQNFPSVSNCPSTSCLCEISYGDVAQIRAYKSGSVKPDTEPLHEDNMTQIMSKYTHQKDDRDKGITYTRVEVDWPLEWLKDGLTIVDSPGVGERPEITEMVKEKMPGAYGFIYVINTTKAGGIQEGELEDLFFKPCSTKTNRSGKNDVQQRHLSNEFDPRTAIFVFNKWDLVENMEKQKIKDFVEGRLKKIFSSLEPESQMFFISTHEATQALEENYITGDYNKLLRGVEKLLDSSMKSKIRKYYNFFAELLSRLAFILKAYTSNFGDIQHKYNEVKEKLDCLTHLSEQFRGEIMAMLKVEAQDIVVKLQRHMQSAETSERLCKWHPSDCPTHATHWNMLFREAGMRSHERVIEEIKRWESETRIFQRANTKLMNAFQDKFVSLKSNLGDIELEILGPESNIPNEDICCLLGDIGHSFTTADNTTFDKTEKIVLGVTAPLWVPFAIIAAPVVIGWAVHAVMKENRKEREYYEGYLKGTSGSISDLMAEETRKKISSAMDGEGLQNVIQEPMYDLVQRMMMLMNKIPEFVKADKELLSVRRQEYEEGINTQTKEQCIKLSKKVSSQQNILDYFMLQYIHIDDIPKENLTQEKLIGEGAFGEVFQYTMETKDGEKIKVAAKITRKLLTQENATEVRLEDFNLRKIQSENTIKYYGLVLCVENEETFPVMLMELCDTALDEIIYNSSKYVGPGNYSPQHWQRPKLISKMRDLAMQLANGLQHMHKVNLVHRDLKPANILVQMRKDNNKSTKYVLKICDFGLTKEEDDILKTMCGTPLYMAPEITNQTGYNKSSDIYSYGLILIELFYGKLVYKLNCLDLSVRPIIFTNDPLAQNSPPLEMGEFMKTCWYRDPGNRPTAEECYEYFKDDTK